ncbi:MAG: ABC transporter permease, partial [Microthrixaceae bacterium]
LSYHVIGLPFAYLLLLLSTATVSIFLSAVAVFIRDVAHMMTLITIGVFFATPIMYQSNQLPTWLQWFPAVNPFAIAISNVRDLVLFGRWFPVAGYLIHLGVAVVLFLGSLAYVRSIEARMVDVA